MSLLVVISLLSALAPQVARAAPASSSAAHVQAPRVLNPVDELARWTARFSPQNAAISSADMSTLEALVADARMLQITAPELRHDIVLALLDLAALQPPDAAAPDPSLMMFGPPQREHASELGIDGVRRALDTDRSGELRQWMASGILAQPKLHSLARRRALLQVLRKRYEPETMLAIMNCATGDERTLRDDAMATLVGWKDDGVHSFMVQQLEKCRVDPKWLTSSVVFTHFASVTIGGQGPAATSLRDYTLRGLSASDWRGAVRALKLIASLDNELAVPVLLTCWPGWIARREQAQGSRRVEGAILAALQKRSGTNIGANPERWMTWWRGVQAGTISVGGIPEPGTVTRAEFFGLRPITDRVVFVIDRSGSMSSPINTATGVTSAGGKGPEVSRYYEAVRQMMACLTALGPTTKFRIVLFETGTHVWKDKLQPATKSNLDAAQRWCLQQHPEGGTMLRGAIEEVLRIGPDDVANIARIEEDTVIVLCDGETTEGPHWVEPLLARVNGDACMEFDCVQIGGAGDGTLQRLATQTGGQCTHVD